MNGEKVVLMLFRDLTAQDEAIAIGCVHQERIQLLFKGEVATELKVQNKHTYSVGSAQRTWEPLITLLRLRFQTPPAGCFDS